MAAWRRAIELALGDADVEKLRSIAQSRTEPASRVDRARILLGYRADPSFFAVGQILGMHHQTVQRCVERAVVEGPMAALDDRPRPGREPTITVEAKAWLTSLACRKAKDLGYPHELWTTRLLARHAREHGPAEGVASEIYIRAYRWCSPPRIGCATMPPNRSIGRVQGASFPSAT
jgi:transposase